MPHFQPHQVPTPRLSHELALALCLALGMFDSAITPAPRGLQEICLPDLQPYSPFPTLLSTSPASTSSSLVLAGSGINGMPLDPHGSQISRQASFRLFGFSPAPPPVLYF